MSERADTHIQATAPDDERDLDELERVVAHGLRTFIEVGHALLEIQNRQLYRQAGYPSFAAYVADRWALSPAHAYRQISASKIVDILSPIGDTPLPVNEAQARELVPLVDDPDTVRRVWTETVKATGNRVTARAIRERVTATTGLTPTQRRPREPSEITCPACGHHWTPR